jgi:hypothetical protein
MMSKALKYLSESRLSQLEKEVPENRERYRMGNFLDLYKENGWEIESSLVKVDSAALADLDGSVRISGEKIQTADVDAKNSVIVYNALQGMTPALAMEERVWTRLSHIECIEYTRARWFYREFSDEAFDRQVQLHFFARTLNGIRDDNAISRLWWNMHIATMLSPSSPIDALGFLLKNADIRSNLVERSWTGARLPLSRGILRMIEKSPWLTAQQSNFREFMKSLNRDGGGILLEAMPDGERDAAVDAIMKSCLHKARRHLGFQAE